MLALAGLLASVLPGTVARADSPSITAAAGAPAGAVPAATDRVAAPDKTLAKGWQTSADRAVTVSGDGQGLHVLAADSSQAYAWRTVATLEEPGFDTDQWIGNSCVTGSGQRAVVVYAPREFTNDQQLMRRGGFAAIVDLTSGQVTKLPEQVSLAYYDPGCGTGESAVLSQSDDHDAQTRLLTVDTTTGKVTQQVTAAGQFTSPVPVGGSIVAAQAGTLTKFDAAGHASSVAATTGSAFDLHPDSAGGLDYLDAADGTTRVHSLTAGKQTTVASGALGTVQLHAGSDGRVFLTGKPQLKTKLPTGMTQLPVAPDATVSTHGALAVDTAVSTDVLAHTQNPLAPEPRGQQPAQVKIHTEVPATKQSVDFSVAPSPAKAGGTDTPSPALAAPSATAPASSAAAAPRAATAPRSAATAAVPSGSPTSTIDDDRGCAIPRNDPAEQALQPTPNQVEWAADMAIRGDLTSNWLNQGGWRSADGLGTVNPQGMFPLPALTGGGRIPAQVLLGIMAQESNLWQASSHAEPGETGNPLVGNFYGSLPYDPNYPDLVWQIDWNTVDCGYGIGQQTDGMHSGNWLRTGDKVWPAAQQKAVALDYASNIAVAAQTLADKWNELHSPSLPAPITINNDDPSKIENWFAAAWDYNEGFNSYSATGPWGLGWGNNPANPIYDQNRLPFLDNNHYADAASPQKWPYEEKVLGWAAWPINTGLSFDDTGKPNNGNTAGYSAAWWINSADRETVKPPLSAFCNSTNGCDSTNPPKCTVLSCFQSLWYTKAATWKDCSTDCGNEYLTYKTLRVEPGNGSIDPPDCASSGLPSGSLVIDSVSGAVPPMAGPCTKWWTDAGTLGFTFLADSSNHYEAKEDLHQIGGGFGAHFWFAHTRNDDHNGAWMQVSGAYKLNRSINAWTRVMVHVPDTGATTGQATYTVHLGNGTVESRVVDQHWNMNRWVDLGVFDFVPGSDFQGAVLTNTAENGTADDDIAWDAMAFKPLPAKPKDFVVAMGDSYSSGEGTGTYYLNTDVDGGKTSADLCHRSPYSWSRQSTLADSSQTIGARADDPNNTDMDYQFIACSGARTQNLLSVYSPKNAFGLAGQDENGELPQMDQGYLDDNTTLVTLSVGGNDSRFVGVLEQCIKSLVYDDCSDTTMDGDTSSLATAEPALINGKVRQSITEVLSEIHVRAPNAKILLMGYPPLFSALGTCILPKITTAVIGAYGIPGVGGVLGSVATVAEILASRYIVPDAAWMDQTGTTLDASMKAAAATASADGINVTFSDPSSAFAGQAVCGSPQTINDLVTSDSPGENGKIPSQQSFHPTVAGAANYAKAADATLRTMRM
ncbi:SGNH/GDSL hydrolase family protein [Kitasatospora sp. NPDC052896]|uniref:SGNH/GDSL hydrolase family protein n=1 Tax=Kitasatospora sp. NPDC052896 TaxID=3364061 RepID=UPI0037C60C88